MSPFFPHLWVPRPAGHFHIDGSWIDGWMDGCMDGRTGKDLVLFCLFLENYLIHHANYFWSPQNTFLSICGEKNSFCQKISHISEIFWIFDDFRKKYREISCIFTNYGGILVLHVLCFSLPPTPKNTHSPPNHPNPPNPQTPYDPLEVLIPSHTNITVTNNYVMVIVILFIKI